MAGAGTGTASAQDIPAGGLEEIVVTGSRIVRRDFTANSPIMTVDRDQFENSSTVALESVLNQMPQFVPAVTQFDTGDVQATATNTPGASLVSLRGLGSNRNLVLLDGRRAMPVNASMAVDINSIPAAAIERVETITGGASSVYGADAMAGVVNFILRRNFEGIDFDVQAGETLDGDGGEFRLSGLFGANVADGRGNVLIGVEHAKRNAAFQRDRDFYTAGWADPTRDGTELFYTDTGFAPDQANLPDPAVVAGIFDEATGVVGDDDGTYFVNDDGTVYTGGSDFGAGEPDGSYRYNGPLTVDGVAFRKFDDQGLIQENQLNSMISIPLDRYSLFGRGIFDLSENVSVFAQGNFTESHTETLLQFSPASNGWGALIPHGNEIYADSLEEDGVTTAAAFLTGGLYGLNCAPTGGCTNSEVFPTPAELTAILDSRADPNAPWQLNRVADFLGPRSTSNNVSSYQVVMGIEGALTEKDWTWEAYTSYGATQVSTLFGGFGSLERYRALVTSPNYGREFFFTGNEGPPGDGFAAGLGRCTSGLPVFEVFMDQPLTQDCVDTVEADLQNTSRMTQTIVEANLQGGIVEMPAGDLRFALGSSYRENDFTFNTDVLTSQPSFIDQGIGLFPAGNSEGTTDVTELYGELLVPLLADKTLVDSLNLELGYRRSDNNPVGNVDTYKALIDWSVNDRVRIRGGRQIANRAPNIGELFLSRTQTLGVSFIGDFCSTAGIAPVGANPAINPDAAEAEALCRQLMGPAGAADYYSSEQSTGGFSFAFTNLVGNPNLNVETAETYTLGAVMNLGERTSMSIDWYQIELSDLIAAQNADNVYTQCLSRAFNPTFDPNHPACQLIVRDPASGFQGPTDVTYSNEAAVKTSGVDIQYNWGTDVGPGALNLSVLASYLIHFETQLNENAPFLDWAGTDGPTLTSLDGGSYEYRTFTTVSYARDPWNLSLRWRYLPELDSGGTVASPTTNTVLPRDAYNIFDLYGGIAVGESMQLRFGIDNLLDADPVITGADSRTTVPESDTGQGQTDEGFYDVLGRRYYVGFKVQF